MRQWALTGSGLFNLCSGLVQQWVVMQLPIKLIITEKGHTYTCSISSLASMRLKETTIYNIVAADEELLCTTRLTRVQKFHGEKIPKEKFE
ncbi:hypothetical protein QVD17_10185 [Tagetes erecta]|uniref:Uncharacterized protein n=1 Tax=Tagetes erecta TaxID=13708 RepID=A0AAD8NZ92_TARER|nr:hypothetical protein QVD17_10185 [Tagetes erecta]